MPNSEVGASWSSRTNAVSHVISFLDGGLRRRFDQGPGFLCSVVYLDLQHREFSFQISTPFLCRCKSGKHHLHAPIHFQAKTLVYDKVGPRDILGLRLIGHCQRSFHDSSWVTFPSSYLRASKKGNRRLKRYVVPAIVRRMAAGLHGSNGYAVRKPANASSPSSAIASSPPKFRIKDSRSGFCRCRLTPITAPPVVSIGDENAWMRSRLPLN